MDPIRVLLADDDADFREALAEVLGSDARFQVVGGVATGYELPALVERLRPHVVLLDVRMPGGGVAAARALTSRPGALRPAVVVLSAQTGRATVVAMMRAGAVGYLAKGQVGPHLPDLVDRCAGGEVVLAVPHGAAAMRQLTRSTT